MSIATGIGSMPGTTDAAYAEAVRLVLGELPDLPYVPELPGRGVTAAMTGRGLALAAGLAADLQGDLRLAARLAPRHGLTFPMSHEPWHVERAGIDTQSG